MPAAHESRQGRLAALRQLVEEKFPAAPTLAQAPRLLTGCTALDQQGGLRRGALTEICSTVAGGQLALAALWRMVGRDGLLAALIDPADSLDPADWPAGQLRRTLWVRGGGVALALKAADFLLRDGNLSLLVLDLHDVPGASLRRVPASFWHRFHRVIEGHPTTFVLLTPRPLVEGVSVRIALQTDTLNLAALGQKRSDLLDQLDGRIYERGQPSDFAVLQKSA